MKGSGVTRNLRASKFLIASHIPLFNYLETILGVLFGYLFFGEVPNVSTIVGGIIVMISIVLYSSLEINGKQS
jgi:drug/metabolite transporter (DMT)-like permease